jgi:nitrogenase molybdenum-iron protein alpha/beta subunit
MAAYTVQTVTEAGITPTYTGVSASDTFTPATADLDKTHILHVKNAGGSPDTVVIDDPNSLSNAAGATAYNPDITVSVTNAQERFIRLAPVRRYVQANGTVAITNSFITSVTAAVFVA